MKKKFLSFLICCLTVMTFAQAPQGFNYQAVARNASGIAITSQPVGLQISLRQGTSAGTIVYSETHAVTSNNIGLINIVVGNGTPVTGTFSSIDWSAGPYFIEISMDVTGGTSYSVMGTQQLMSVPYALYAANSAPGSMGATGPTGTNGVDGATGNNGTNGIDGATGATGSAGTNGIDGATGNAGTNGSNGTNGVTGATGLAGTNGAIGATGITGTNGSNGTNGVTGATGTAGTNGTNGTNGITGATGSAGTNGVTGATGTAGTNGTNGITGATGTAGTNGVTGATGTAGTNGTNGITGATGTAGTNGVTGTTGTNGATGATGAAGGGTATYRYAVFHTYDEQTSWAFGNDPLMFGGINPSNWTDAGALASQISPNKDVQRTLFQHKGYAKENAMIHSRTFEQYSSTDGEVCTVLFRINNTTGSAISWQPYFYYTCYSVWGEMASITVNGANSWSSGTSGTASPVLSIPPGQVSTVIFVSTSSQALSVSGGIYVRSTRLAFYNNSLTLPAGLTYLDDLDTATGGWGN